MQILLIMTLLSNRSAMELSQTNEVYVLSFMNFREYASCIHNIVIVSYTRW